MRVVLGAPVLCNFHFESPHLFGDQPGTMSTKGLQVAAYSLPGPWAPAHRRCQQIAVDFVHPSMAAFDTSQGWAVSFTVPTLPCTLRLERGSDLFKPHGRGRIRTLL